MRYYCNECGCEFYYYMSYTFEKVKCPQCQSINIAVDYWGYYNATTN